MHRTAAGGWATSGRSLSAISIGYDARLRTVPDLAAGFFAADPDWLPAGFLAVEPRALAAGFFAAGFVAGFAAGAAFRAAGVFAGAGAAGSCPGTYAAASSRLFAM